MCRKCCKKKICKHYATSDNDDDVDDYCKLYKMYENEIIFPT